jgi:hypothetical protein
MNSIRGLVAVFGIAALALIAVACGGADHTAAGSMAPDLHLTFEGVDYIGAEIAGAVSADGSIVAGGAPIDMTEMEIISIATIHYPDHDAITEVYQPAVGSTTDVFTFHPARTVGSSSEPGGEYTSPATWTRWTVSQG